MYRKAVDGLHRRLLSESLSDRLLYVTELQGGKRHFAMHHLACFLPGMLVLGTEEVATENAKRDQETAYRLM